MKIWQVVPYYPPHVGGMEYYVERLSEELAARGHDVTVFTSSNNGTQQAYTRNGVKIRTLKIMTKLYNIPIVPNLFSQLTAEEKPDIIHTHQYPVFFSDMAAAASWIKKIPLIVHVHVISDAKSPLSGFISDMYYSTLGLRTLTTANTIIVPSMAYKTKLSKMHVNPNRLQVIPYGIDTKKFQNKNGEAFKAKYDLQESKVILSVGRLNYQKGFQYLIKAMPTVLQQIPNAKLVLVGEGEQLSYLRQLTKSLSLEKIIVFTGAINQTEIPYAYAAADIFVLPSLFESFGISLIEAQAAGKPVVGTRVGGIPETFKDGETGFLVEPGDVEQLEEVIIRILSDSDIAKELGRKGKCYAASFEIKKSINRIIKEYDKIVFGNSNIRYSKFSTLTPYALKKILFVTSFAGKEYGGAEISTRLLLDKLIECGYDVQALTTRKVNFDKSLVSITSRVEIPKQMLMLGNRNIDYFFSRKIKKQLIKIKPNIIHVQDTYILPAVIMANKQLKIPCVATIRNSILDSSWDLMFPAIISSILKRRNKKIIQALHNVNCIIAVSQYIKSELIERGISSRKIFPVYNLPPSFNGVIAKPQTRDCSVVHLFAPGFLIGFKGFFVLIKAMNKVIESGVKIDLTIAGDGPDRRALELLTKDLRLVPYIKFTGKLTFEALFDFYSNCDIVVIPSIFPEPFGRVALEAMFFGKPIVASRVGGIPELIKDKQTGLLVSPGVPEELAQAILILVKDPKLRESMGKSGKLVSDTEFSSKRIVDKHLRIYLNCYQQN